MAVKIYPAKLNAEAAQALLDDMAPENRRPAKTTVDRYKTDMLSGSWHNFGAPIVRRASDGKMMDGGNRMAALIAAAKHFPGIELEFQIAEGVPDEYFKYIDNGRPRTNRDVMIIGSGGKSSGKGAGIVTWTWKYRRGNPLGAAGGRAKTPTRSEFLELYLSDPDGFETSALRGRDFQRHRVVPFTVAGTFHYITKTTEGIGEEKAEQFFSKLLTGAGLDDDLHPILQVRNRLIARGFPRSTESRSRAYSAGEAFYLLHRAWRAYWTDERVQIILPKNTVTNENFPPLYIPEQENHAAHDDSV